MMCYHLFLWDWIFAKEFTGNTETVKPSLTGNFGDDESESIVHLARVNNIGTNVFSKVLDNFTHST